MTIENSDKLKKPCPVLQNKLCQICPKQEAEWDINRLLQDMARAKGIATTYEVTGDLTEEELNELTLDLPIQSIELKPREQCWLELLLAGFSVEQIEKILNSSKLLPDISRTIYKYIKVITQKKVTNWAQVRLYCEQEGYRKTIPNQILISQETLRIKIVITGNISEEKRQELIEKIRRLLEP